LYTNNKLTPRRQLHASGDHLKKYGILPIPVGTDNRLALETRRETGCYLTRRLVRRAVEHNGSVATLEDWFEPRRLTEGYAPTGFIGYGLKTRAVKGHEFGLKLSADDRTRLWRS
jgi:hypothetical protein